MNLRRILRLAAAFGAVSAAAAASIVAAALALYAVAEAFLGAAGGAAVVALTFAGIAVAVAWLASRKVVARDAKAPAAPPSLVDRAVGFAKERPLIALGAAAALATVAVRNPAVISAAVSAFLAGSASKGPK